MFSGDTASGLCEQQSIETGSIQNLQISGFIILGVNIEMVPPIVLLTYSESEKIFSPSSILQDYPRVTKSLRCAS